MADCHVTTILPAARGPTWIAQPAEFPWRSPGSSSKLTAGRFHAPGTIAAILNARDAIPIFARKCPSCGKTMSERILTDKDGKIVGTQYRCENPKCKAK